MALKTTEKEKIKLSESFQRVEKDIITFDLLCIRSTGIMCVYLFRRRALVKTDKSMQ